MGFFISSKRCIIGILFIASGVFSVLMLESATQLIGVLFCILIGLLLILPDILYLKTSSDKLWSKWSDVSGESKNKRIERASMKEFTAIKIDKKFRYGRFLSSNNKVKYRTTLTSCTCPDYKKRHLPCKHMYYIASECGIENL